MMWAPVRILEVIIFVEQEVKINTDLYNNYSLVPIFKEIKKHFKYQPFTFQQDGAPSPTSIKTEDC